MASTTVLRHGQTIGLDQTWGAAAYVSAREEAARHHGRLSIFGKAFARLSRNYVWPSEPPLLSANHEIRRIPIQTGVSST
jgi:hypothetical protein